MTEAEKRILKQWARRWEKGENTIECINRMAEEYSVTPGDIIWTAVNFALIHDDFKYFLSGAFGGLDKA